MNNDILYEVVKYLDCPVASRRVSDAQSSRTNATRMIRLAKGLLEKRLLIRPDITSLRAANIYKEDCINFGRIHKELSDVFCRRGSPPFRNISSSLAPKVKMMDFKLRKILLASRIRNRRS